MSRTTYLHSLTKFLACSNVRRAWRDYLPGTRRCVSTINRILTEEHSLGLLPSPIPPGSWVSRNKLYVHLATVYEEAVGWLMAGRSSLFPVRGRVNGYGRLAALCDPLEELIRVETQAVRAGKTGERHLDFFRSLALLVDLDATAHGFKLARPVTVPRRVRSMGDLRALLRRRYPTEFARELHLLSRATQEDLPHGEPVQYKPSFKGSWDTGRWEGIDVDTSGDLLIGDTLIELKASVKLFQGDYLRYLLACAALNALQRRRSLRHDIRQVGVYNPRYRALWIGPVDYLVHMMGGGSFRVFCQWFRSTLPKQVEGTGVQWMVITGSHRVGRK